VLPPLLLIIADEANEIKIKLMESRRRKMFFVLRTSYTATILSTPELKIRKSFPDAKTRLHVNYSVAGSWHSENISRRAPYLRK